MLPTTTISRAIRTSRPRTTRSIAGVTALLAVAAMPSGVVSVAALASETTLAASGHAAYSWGVVIDDRPDRGDRVGGPSPTQVGSDGDWATVSAGFNHTVGIRTNGTLWAWGYNFYGQLGDGTKTNSFAPVQVGSDTDWASVAAGYEATLAIKADGTLWSWGTNEYTLLGQGSSYGDWTEVLAPTQIGSSSDWAAVSAGGSHVLALKADGTLWSWGQNPVGELGNGSTTSSWVPTQVGTDNDWSSVAAGTNHSLAVKTDGSLWSWGFNVWGQLGDGTTTSHDEPARVGSDTDWVSAVASQSTLALKSDGSLWGWGRNDFGQLGDGTTTHRSTPVRIGGDATWRSVGSGAVHSVGVRADGTLWAWGANHQGQLGIGTSNAGTSSPVRVGTGTDWSAAAARYYNSVALRTAPDSTPPSVEVTSPAAEAAYRQGEVVLADYTCADPAGVASCSGDAPVGSPVDTGVAGDHTFTVSTVDAVGNSGTRTVSYTVLAGSAEAQLTGAGGTVTTDPTGIGATPQVPVQTTVTAPSGVAGALTVTPQGTDTAAPSGFELFGTEVVLSGPTATPEAPYQVTFTVDGSALQGVAPADVQVFRNGSVIAGCTHPVAAVPDPCVVARGFGAEGDAVVTVRTSRFSTWSFGRLDFALSGPFQPVDAAPTINGAKAGSAVPVKFRLGGDRGLDVLAAGYPKITALTCAGTRTDEIEQTLDGSAASLAYDAANDLYTYKWKTSKAMKGCRELILKFRDGTQLGALFDLR